MIEGESQKSGMMKIKALVEGILAGVVSAIFCYSVLIKPAELAALAMRRKTPEARVSGLIDWYAMFAVIGVSIVAAGIASRVVYKYASSPRA